MSKILNKGLLHQMIREVLAESSEPQLSWGETKEQCTDESESQAASNPLASSLNKLQEYFDHQIALREYKLQEMELIGEDKSSPLLDPKPEQLTDSSKSKQVGDPMDVELNQMVDEKASDEKIATAVKITGGKPKPGNDHLAGQRKPEVTSKPKPRKGFRNSQ